MITGFEVLVSNSKKVRYGTSRTHLFRSSQSGRCSRQIGVPSSQPALAFLECKLEPGSIAFAA